MAVVYAVIESSKTLGLRSTSGTGLSGGDLKALGLGIIFGLLFFLLFLYLLYYIGRSKSLKEVIKRQDTPSNHNADQEPKLPSRQLWDEAYYLEGGRYREDAYPGTVHTENQAGLRVQRSCIPSSGVGRTQQPRNGISAKLLLSDDQKNDSELAPRWETLSDNTSSLEQHAKQARSEAKRILGTDDNSFLNTLPTYDGNIKKSPDNSMTNKDTGQRSDHTAAPAYVPSDSKGRFHDAKDHSTPGLQKESFDNVEPALNPHASSHDGEAYSQRVSGAQGDDENVSDQSPKPEASRRLETQDMITTESKPNVERLPDIDAVIIDDDLDDQPAQGLDLFDSPYPVEETPACYTPYDYHDFTSAENAIVTFQDYSSLNEFLSAGPVYTPTKSSSNAPAIKMKRGRPTKAESQHTAHEAAARGEEYPAPKKRGRSVIALPESSTSRQAMNAMLAERANTDIVSSIHGRCKRNSEGDCMTLCSVHGGQLSTSHAELGNDQQMTNFQQDFTNSTSGLAETPQEQVESTTIVNPWSLEFQPNPVMFPHLSHVLGYALKRNIRNCPPPALLTSDLTSLEDSIELHGPHMNDLQTTATMEAPSATFDPRGDSLALQLRDPESPSSAIHALGSDTSDLLVDNVLSVTATSAVLPSHKGKGRHVDEPGAPMFINRATPLPTGQPSRDTCYNVSVIWSRSSCERVDGGVIALDSHVCSQSSSPLAAGTAQTSNSLSASTETSTSSLYSCPVCHLKFRTPGLRRYVAFKHKRYSVFKHLCSPKLS
jgi:hypothetical protein